MQAPKWEFPIQDIPSQQSGASDGALYLGSLPSRPPAAYTAILPFRPNSMPKGANAVLGFGLGSREPHLTLVLDGEPVLTLTHQHAFFHSVLLLLQVLPLHLTPSHPFPSMLVPAATFLLELCIWLKALMVKNLAVPEPGATVCKPPGASPFHKGRSNRAIMLGKSPQHGVLGPGLPCFRTGHSMLGGSRRHAEQY